MPIPTNSMPARIGLGTHRIGERLPVILKEALALGIDWFDTAPNYDAGRAQRHLGITMRSHLDAGLLLGTANISTKVGFISPTDRAALISRKIIDEAEARLGHSLSRTYINWQIDQNVEQLQFCPIEILFLHNPEVQLRLQNKTKWLKLISRAFETCEKKRDLGLIRSYGIATWSSLFESITLSELVALANLVGGEQNGFRALQLPVNLANCMDIHRALFEQSGPIHCARDMGLAVLASAALGGGNILKLVTNDFVRLFAPHLSCAQFAAQFVRSTRMVAVMLFSTTNISHLREMVELQNVELFDLDKIKWLVSKIKDL